MKDQFNAEDLYKQAVEIITTEEVFFVRDIIAFLPCSVATFYRYLPEASDTLNNLKEELTNNKIVTKRDIRRKLDDLDSATALLALYKLIATASERDALSMQPSKQDDSQILKSIADLFPPMDGKENK